jgi:hypothetical protein
MTSGQPYRLGRLVPALGMLAPALAAEFPGYDFGMQQTYGGPALVAVRRDGAAGYLRRRHQRPRRNAPRP